MLALFRWVGRRRVLVVSFLLMVVAVALFAMLDQERPAGAPGAVSLELAFTTATFGQIIDAWGVEGVRAYRDSIVYVDYWFAFVYALFLSALVAVVRRSPQEPPSNVEMILFALPGLAAAMDWTENTLHLILLRGQGGLSAALVYASSFAAAVKWSLLALVATAIIVTALGKLRRN